MTINGAFHPKSSADRLYTRRKEGGRGLHKIKNVGHQEEQSLKSDVSSEAESNPLIAECKRLIAIRKEPDETAAWYEKSAWCLAQRCVRICRHGPHISMAQ